MSVVLSQSGIEEMEGMAIEYLQSVRVIAVRNYIESKSCILCGDIVNLTLDPKISKCDSCKCIQITTECKKTISARVIIKTGDDLFSLDSR